MRLEPQALEPCLQYLRAQLTDLQAIYLFGSEATGQAGPDSDVDLAVLLPTSLPAVRRWLLMEHLAEQLGRDVDLVDLRSASTVMRHQVLAQGQRLWSAGRDADVFELSAFSEYWDLAIQRRELLADIERRGSIHAR